MMWYFRVISIRNSGRCLVYDTVLVGVPTLVVALAALLVVTALRIGRKVGTRAPFYAVVAAFATSLFCADFVIRQFHTAQPATIYIVPLCMLAVMFWVVVSGHWAELKKPVFGKELYAPDEQETDMAGA